MRQPDSERSNKPTLPDYGSLGPPRARKSRAPVEIRPETDKRESPETEKSESTETAKPEPAPPSAPEQP